MRDLRERFRSLDRIEVPDLRREIRDGPHILVPRPKPAGRLVAAIVALAVAAGGTLVAVRAFSGQQQLDRPPVSTPLEPPPDEPILEVDPRVTARIDLGPGEVSGGGVAVGYGSVWVGVFAHADGRHYLLRIDPSTNEVVASIPVRGYSHVAVGAGAVWVTGSEKGKVFAERIDPSTNQVVARVSDVYAPIEAGESFVWAAGGLSGTGEGMTIAKIDPASNQVIARMPIGAASPFDIDAGEGAIWAVAPGSTRQGPGALYRVDPATGDVVVLPPGGLQIALGEGYVWLPGEGDTVMRIDAATYEAVEIPVDGDLFKAIGVGEGGVWFLARRGVCRLNLVSLQLDSCIGYEQVGTPQIYVDSVVLDTENHAIWVVNYDEGGHDTLTRIDLGS